MAATILEMRSGPARVRVAPALGGRITSAALGNRDGEPVAILHPYPEHVVELLPWAKGGLYPLVPYSGRIRDAKLLHDGRTVKLAPHPGGEPHTLHGIAQQRAWEVVELGDNRVTMRYGHSPDAHWPWPFESRLAVTLSDDALRVDISLVNTGDRTMPGGVGLHPYLRHEARDALLYEADPPWPYDRDAIAGDPPVGGTARQAVTADEFAAGEVTRFHAGRVGELSLVRQIGPTLRITADEVLSHLVLHRPAGAPYICIEPVSHVADGFNLSARGVAGTGTRLLRPGESMSGRMEVRVAS